VAVALVPPLAIGTVPKVIFGAVPPDEDKGLEAVTAVTVPPDDGDVLLIVKLG
jgi:hypothetical protein